MILERPASVHKKSSKVDASTFEDFFGVGGGICYRQRHGGGIYNNPHLRIVLYRGGYTFEDFFVYRGGLIRLIDFYISLLKALKAYLRLIDFCVPHLLALEAY